MNDRRVALPAVPSPCAPSRRGFVAGALAAVGLLLPSRRPAAAKLAKDVEIVFMANDTGPFWVEVWQEDPDDGGSYVRKWGERSIAPDRSVAFTGNENKMALVVLQDRQDGVALPVSFFFKNPKVGKPDAVIAAGTWGRNGAKRTGDVYADQSMAVGDEIFMDGYRVVRNEDRRDYKVFLIEATGSRA